MTIAIQKRIMEQAERFPVAGSPAEALSGSAVVVIGGGPAGIRTAQELARGGQRVVLLNAERWRPYNRVKLTPLLSGDVQLGQVEQCLEFPGPGKVSLYSDTRVVGIDRIAKTVTAHSGRSWAYDKLVICTGSRAHVPPIPGIDLPGVFTFRNFDDVEKLVARSVRARRCVVVGGGLLGLEAARGMHDRGADTVVIEHETGLMARQLDARGGALLKAAVEDMVINVMTSTRVAEFGGDTRLERVSLAGGDSIVCDTAIICTGIRANIELARDIGLAVGRGIKVGPTLQTTDPDIYAVGECAEHAGNIYGLVGPGYEQAAVAAAHIATGRGAYRGSVPATKLKIVGTEVFSMGDVEQLEQRRDVATVEFEDQAAGLYRRLVLRGNRLVGAIAIGDCGELARIQEAIKNGYYLLPWQQRRFRASGMVWPKTEPRSVKDWPRAATVCNCTGVTRGQIGDAIAVGASNLDEVKLATGASTVCGSCKVHIGELLDAPPPREPVKLGGSIAAFSVAAAIFALLTFALPIIPTATEIERRGWSDMLYLDGYAKQVTGYTVLALSVLLAAISVRKRVPFLWLGDFAGWRVIHTVLGAVALVALFAHTGFRLGSNLNMWLMLTFLGLAVAGAVAGLATAFEHRVSGSPRTAARLRSASFWMHLVAFWPFPLLLAAHVLTVYFY